MMKWFFISALVSAGLALSACATPQQLQLVEREQRRLRSHNLQMLMENEEMRDELSSVRSGLADTRANLRELRRNMNALAGKLDEVRYLMKHRINESGRDGGQSIQELEARLAGMESDLRAQEALLKAHGNELRLLRGSLVGSRKGEIIASKEGSGKDEGFLEDSSQVSDEIRKHYMQARALLEQKDYRDSIERLKEFLRKYPESDYADNAQYWIGESHYVLGEFRRAILEFDAVRRNYPDGDKVPASLLQMGFAFAELGDKVATRLIFQELIEQYPRSQEAAKAQRKLEILGS